MSSMLHAFKHPCHKHGAKFLRKRVDGVLHQLANFPLGHGALRVVRLAHELSFRRVVYVDLRDIEGLRARPQQRLDA